jgi:hypothetical protein
MRIVSCLFFLLFIFASSALAQGSTAWVKYTSDAGRYGVLFPTEPKLSEQDAGGSGSLKFKQYLASSSISTGYFLVGYFDLGSGVTYSLDKGRDGVVNAVKGTLLSEESISLNGRPGRALRVKARSANFDIIALARIYEINGRVYVLQALSLDSESESTRLQLAKKFFDSFSVRDK